MDCYLARFYQIRAIRDEQELSPQIYPKDKNMTAATTNTISSPSTSFISGLMRNILAKYRRNMEIKVTERALRAMSDRELQDIGLHRGMIYEVARR